uniref:Glycine cleavage system transcriptional repressor n=1 Tax=uncultured Thiotrichaceae bacterium TaxID=298394 RepID=A0A6S6SU51_9GAMM|nr:MAG: ACT domain protein [uncultured Thiotrichaceae bacterium]
MQVSLVLTVLSDDQSGLVQRISEVLVEHEANWTESRMVHLAGKFAGLLQATVAQDKLEALKAGLQGLQASHAINILIEQVGAEALAAIEPAEELTLKVLGQDMPGIVNRITEALANLKVNVEELTSEQRSAPMSAEKLFYANITMGLPEGVSADDVQDALEGLSEQLMVDLQFS